LFVFALAVVCNQPLSAAPLFSRVDGSLSAALSDEARSAMVQLDQTTLRTAKAGSEVSVHIPDVGGFRYRIVRRSTDGDVVRLEGVLIGHDQHRIILGVRKEGVSGSISTPAGVFSLGYVNDRQWLGVVGKPWDWKSIEDSGRPVLFEERTAQKGEDAPVPGAQPIEVNLGELTALQEGDEATLRLSDVGPLRVSYDETRANQDSASWIGHLKDFGRTSGSFSYSPRDDGSHPDAAGRIRDQSSALGRAYLIDPRKLGMQPMQGGEACSTAVEPVPPTATRKLPMLSRSPYRRPPPLPQPQPRPPQLSTYSCCTHRASSQTRVGSPKRRLLSTTCSRWQIRPTWTAACQCSCAKWEPNKSMFRTPLPTAAC
jgi:hypothetical protein